MRITSKGQVTIPANIREQAGLLPHSEVEFEFDGTFVRIIPATKQRGSGRGARLVAHLRGRGDVAMSTDAIMALTRDGTGRLGKSRFNAPVQPPPPAVPPGPGGGLRAAVAHPPLGRC